MLDGLDETDPDSRDKYTIPWVSKLCKMYAKSQFLISSRPVGYPPGTLQKLRFSECELLDFSESEMREYARHWCIAVRLAQNEPTEEARHSGNNDGDAIIAGFEGHPYIRNLARNPLMLSGVCLVNYFEHGELPKDRAVLYKLCVEGLLHNWDQRRGIRSEFSFDEKLRACRKVAFAMQASDRAEYEGAKVQKIFAEVLGDDVRAQKLFEHIRYRTGLLLERRSGIFAFAHLTFQEYLAARAVFEDEQLGVTPDRLAIEHSDGRWKEVIALYCGLTPPPTARKMIEQLITQEDSVEFPSVLADAYLSSGQELSRDRLLRNQVLERIAICTYRTSNGLSAMERFADNEVGPIANSCAGTKTGRRGGLTSAHFWLAQHPEAVDWARLIARLMDHKSLNSFQAAELVYLLHRSGPDEALLRMSREGKLYAKDGPAFERNWRYSCQAEVALVGLLERKQSPRSGIGCHAALRQILRKLCEVEDGILTCSWYRTQPVVEFLKAISPAIGSNERNEFISLARRVSSLLRAKPIPQLKRRQVDSPTLTDAFDAWASDLERGGPPSKRGRRANRKILHEEPADQK